MPHVSNAQFSAPASAYVKTDKGFDDYLGGLHDVLGNIEALRDMAAQMRGSMRPKSNA